MKNTLKTQPHADHYANEQWVRESQIAIRKARLIAGVIIGQCVAWPKDNDVFIPEHLALVAAYNGLDIACIEDDPKGAARRLEAALVRKGLATGSMRTISGREEFIPFCRG